MPSTERAPTRIVTVAGKDRGADLGRDIAAAAEALHDAGLAGLLEGESEILRLGAAANEAEFLDRQIAVLTRRTQVDMDGCETPPAAGPASRVMRVLRRILWRLMRYPSDFIAFNQNAINCQFVHALELEARLRRRETEALRRRLAAIEADRRGGEPPRP